jgi:transcriptional regulator with XRE-family HTH domain
MNPALARVIGTAARAARARLELTQAQVAQAVDIAPMVYSRLERGVMLPSVPTLVRLCQVLHSTPDELLGFSSASSQAAPRPTRAWREQEEALRHLLSIARKLDAEKVQALITMAQALLR